MTLREETAEFLEDVLRATFINVDEGHLKIQEDLLEHDQTPKDKSAETLYDGVLDTYHKLAAAYGVDISEEKVLVREVEYDIQKKAFEKFMTQNRHVIDYIATLASGSRKKVQTPSEEIVFDTLKRLSGKMIMGELGAGAETLEATLILNGIVKTAAYKHAQRIGQNPEAYYSRVIADQQDTFITL